MVEPDPVDPLKRASLFQDHLLTVLNQPGGKVNFAMVAIDGCIVDGESAEFSGGAECTNRGAPLRGIGLVVWSPWVRCVQNVSD